MNDGATNEEMTFGEYLSDSLGVDPIPNPHAENSYMAILTVHGKNLIGGIDDLPEGTSSWLVLYAPLIYGEVPISQDDRGNMSIAPAFQKIFFIFQSLPYQLVRPSALYVFSKDRRSDKMLTLEYEKSIKMHIGSDAGIEIASVMPSGMSQAH